jgi:hypothetical protein
MVNNKNNDSLDLDSLYAEIKNKLEALNLRVEALEEAKYYESKN